MITRRVNYRYETMVSAANQTAHLADMARVEALDAMGENRKAVELLDRYV